MGKRWKHFFPLVLGIMILISNVSNHIQAAVPVSLALELSSQKMSAGESMEVSVSLQNYDKNFTENVITTMIVEVSVDTDKLSIDSESLEEDFSSGSGGFSVVQMADENNVELQYLNVGDPLAKGTEKLFHFTITANQDITDLTEAVKITYAVMQDGTQEESVKLTVVPFTTVNGETVEQATIAEQYTSEYGTIASVNVSGNSTSNDDSANGGNSTSNVDSVNGGNSTNNDDSANGGDSTNNGSTANGNSTSNGNSGNTENSDVQDNSEEIMESQATVNDVESEEQTTVSDIHSSKNKDNAADSENADKNPLPAIIAGVIIMAAAAGGVYFIQKRKNR